MFLKLKLRKIGGPVGVILPKKVLTLLKVREGDSVLLTEELNGGLRLRSKTTVVNHQMEMAQTIVGRYRQTLRDLAK